MSSSCSGMGFSGISTVQFSARCRLNNNQTQTAESLLPGTSVVFSASGFVNIPDFVLGFAEISGNILSITAYDKTANSDIIFTSDNTVFTEFDGDRKDSDGNRIRNRYSGRDVLTAAANKLGLGAMNVDNLPEYLYYSEFIGKPIRTVLNDLSACGVGFFYVRENAALSLAAFGVPTGNISADSAKCGKFETSGKKIISRVFVTDETYSDTYSAGSGNWYSSVSIGSPYLFGETACLAAASKITGKTYQGWKQSFVFGIGDMPPIPGMLWGSGNNAPVIREIRVRFGAVSFVADVGSPAAQMSMSDFQNEEIRAVNTKVQTNKVYGNVFIDKNNGLAINYEGAT